MKLANSPAGWVANAFSGLSISFAPGFLYLYGKGLEPIGPGWFGIPLCWLIILSSGFFLIKLAQHVIKQLKDGTPLEGKG